jgi:hypothetical protein
MHLKKNTFSSYFISFFTIGKPGANGCGSNLQTVQFNRTVHLHQGVPIFARWVIVCIAHLLENYNKCGPNIWPHLFTVKVMHLFWPKMGWATFWALFHKLIWSP